MLHILHDTASHFPECFRAFLDLPLMMLFSWHWGSSPKRSSFSKGCFPQCVSPDSNTSGPPSVRFERRFHSPDPGSYSSGDHLPPDTPRTNSLTGTATHSFTGVAAHAGASTTAHLLAGTTAHAGACTAPHSLANAPGECCGD